MPEAFLTVAELAELLKLNQQTIHNCIDQRALPTVRVGSRRMRIRRSDLDRYLNVASESISTGERQHTDAMSSASTTDMLRRQELAQRLGRSLRWVDARVKEGMPSVPPVGQSRRRRFVLDEVEAWLERRAPADPAGESQGTQPGDVQQLASSLTNVLTATRGQDTAVLVAALRAVAGAAARLADALERAWR